MLQLWFIANTVLWTLRTKFGGMSLGLNVVVLVLVGVIWIGKRLTITASSAKVLLFFLAYAVISFFVAVSGPCTDLFVKSLVTLPILVLLLLLGLEIGRRSDDCDWLKLQTIAWWALLFAFSGFIVELLIPKWFPEQQTYRVEGKLSGLFQEPSHVAFSLFPCVAVLLVATDKTTRQKGILSLLVLLVVSRSSTLIVLIAAWVTYRLFVQRKVRRAALSALGIVLLVALASAVNYDLLVVPTVDRIVGITTPTETTNQSSIVYVLGWQDAWFNLQRTHGMGLGLNMMGCSPLPDVSIRDLLALGGYAELNAEDGSFLFSKVVSETGVIGILFYIIAIWWWVRLERKLRLHTHRDHSAMETQAALIFCFLILSFIRGSGYFGGGLLLWVTAVGAASKWHKHLSNTTLGEA